MSTSKARATEVDAYIFIKENLKFLGWDARNPERVPEGQVWTQNECLGNQEIKRFLGLKRPENIVKVSEKVLWVIEAKRSRDELGAALNDAYGRARILNRSKRFQVKFISGLAGNSTDGFVIQTDFLEAGNFRTITWNGVAVTGLLGPADLRFVLEQDSATVQNPRIDEKQFFSRATSINEILHLGAVNPHQRAGVMAALLLAMLSDTGPNIEERSPTILINDINSRVQNVLAKQGKAEFYDFIKIALPATADNHVKFRQALVDTIQELNSLNIKSAMHSGDDWLGAFYEVFLKYASWAQDLGIVLTPRHLTRWAADVMDIRNNDLVYDPTCGTGGFLVAAFDQVKRQCNAQQIDRFKQNCLFGVEQESGVAALAVVNMIFRGDGKNHIKEGNCFVQFLQHHSHKGLSTAKFVTAKSDQPPITKVMMNPPFSLKRGTDKEYKFVNQALLQMEDGGILFAILPYSAMCKPKGYDTWRKTELLPQHTLLAVVSFPVDIFYPVGVTTVGVFIRKGTPHPVEQNVLWIRAPGDGFFKSKGKRLPHPKASNELSESSPILKAFLRDPSCSVEGVLQFYKTAPIDWQDRQVELVPEVYLDQSKPTVDELFDILEEDLRNLLAYLITIGKEKLDHVADIKRKPFGKTNWKSYAITDLFNLDRGHFHSIAALEAGKYPTISRVSTDNGCVGFFDIPENASIWPAKTITVSSVTGDSFLQPTPFIATDNVVLCTLKTEHKNLKLSSLIFIQAMMNHMKWRYSYGRQCYKTKYAKTEIWLPFEKGRLNERYMSNMVEQAKHWRIIEGSFSS